MFTVADPRDSSVQDFARKLGCEWIGMVPSRPSPLARELMCHQNVAEQVEIFGGASVRGYYFVSYRDGLDIQAILHTVWNDNGMFVDITPIDGVDYICFAYGNKLHEFSAVYYNSLSKYMNNEIDFMYYVYLLVDPRTNLPFYVGKDTGKRAQQHRWNVSRTTNSYKNAMISAIRRAGLEPSISYVAENIADENLACDMETNLIRHYVRKGCMWINTEITSRDDCHGRSGTEDTGTPSGCSAT